MQKCGICNTDVLNMSKRLRTGIYHRECLSMQDKGLLRTGGEFRPKDSTGKPCGGCRQEIDGPHAHRSGVPFHRECLL